MHIVCIICTSSFNQNDHVVSTPCGHLFHYACLAQWLASASTCPTCRKNCRVAEMKRIYVEVSMNGTRVDLSETVVAEILERHRGSPRAQGNETQMFLRDEALAIKESIIEDNAQRISELYKIIDEKDEEITNLKYYSNEKDQDIADLKGRCEELLKLVSVKTNNNNEPSRPHQDIIRKSRLRICFEAPRPAPGNSANVNINNR